MPHDDVELLRLVEDWRPPAALHPIAMRAWRLYAADQSTLSDQSLQTLRAVLDGYGGDLKPLGEALEGLVRFSLLLSDHEQNPVAAQRIISLMREYTPLFEPLLARIAQARAAQGSAPRPAPDHDAPPAASVARRDP